MRAYNYYNLVLAFNNVPIIESPGDGGRSTDCSRTTRGKAVLKLIADDLYEACECMPSYPYDGWSKLAFGKVTCWAAETLLGLRAFPFLHGFLWRIGDAQDRRFHQ